jgi:hypothetical protein
MTIHDTELAEIEAQPNHRARVEYAVRKLGVHPDTVAPETLRAWFEERGYKLGDKTKRPTISGHLNEWRKELRASGLDTGAIRAMTPGTLATMDKERGFVGTPQETTPAGVEGSYNLDHATVADFEPSPNAPQSPAVSAPRQATAPRQGMTSLPPVMSTPRVAPSEPDASETPSPAPASRDTDASVSDAPAVSDASASDTDATVTQDPKAARKAARRQRRASWRGKAWTYASGKFIWLQYVLLLQVAAYGLSPVLDQVAGAPFATALGGALGIELVGISLKMLSDRAESDGENYKVVKGLLFASGVVAVGIGAANAWGHSQMTTEPGENPYVGAVLFGLSSIAGYSMWTIRTALAHRADRRRRGQLEGPGIKVPAYVRKRYGNPVADRAELLSRYDSSLSIPEYVAQARAEIDAEAREKREASRREALRKALIEYTQKMHASPLAADLDASRYSEDQLSDMFTASTQEHAARRAELLAWRDNDKK